MPATTYEDVESSEHVYEDILDSDIPTGWTGVRGATVPDKARSVPPPVNYVQVKDFRVFQPVIGPAAIKNRQRYLPYDLQPIPLDEEWKPKVEATLRKESVKHWQVAGLERGNAESEKFLFQQAPEEEPQNAALPLAIDPAQLSGYAEAVFEWLSVITFIKGAEDPDPDMHWPLPVLVPKNDVWAARNF